MTPLAGPRFALPTLQLLSIKICWGIRSFGCVSPSAQTAIAAFFLSPYFGASLPSSALPRSCSVASAPPIFRGPAGVLMILTFFFVTVLWRLSARRQSAVCQGLRKCVWGTVKGWGGSGTSGRGCERIVSAAWPARHRFDVCWMMAVDGMQVLGSGMDSCDDPVNMKSSVLRNASLPGDQKSRRWRWDSRGDWNWGCHLDSPSLSAREWKRISSRLPAILHLILYPADR